MTPAQHLAMEVLAARHRLGEPFWTFQILHEPVLRELEEDDLVFVMHGIAEGSVRAGLTDKGKQLFLSADYVPPILRPPREAKDEYQICSAVIHHGPGHQSKTRCGLTSPHEIHEAVYGSLRQFAEWRGDAVTTGFFDEPPELEE